MHTARTYLLQYILTLTVTSTGAAGFFFQALSGNRPNEMQPGANKQPNSRLSLQPQTATTGVQEGGHGFSDGSAVAVGLWKRLAVQIAQVRPRQARWSRRRVLDESSALPVSHAHHQS